MICYTLVTVKNERGKHKMKIFKRFKKTKKTAPRFDPEFLAYVKSIEIEKMECNPMVIDALRSRAELEYFRTNKI